jgi:hypothetical protein
MGDTVKLLGFVPALVLLVLAAAAALLAADVHSWQSTLRSDDALVTVSSPPTRFPFSAAEDLLGVRDDVALRRAIDLYRRNVSLVPSFDNAAAVAVSRAQAEDALAAIARSGNKEHASQAETLLGILAFGDLKPVSTNPFGVPESPSTAPGPDQVQASIGDFQDAVRADPTNTAAKYDLELMLRLLVAQGVRVGSSNQSGTGSTGRRGAGGGVPGQGY